MEQSRKVRTPSSADDANPAMLARLKRWADAIWRDVNALWLAARDHRTPWRAKALALAVTAYALSPIDLIPDFVPVLGYLDDLIIVPLGIVLAVRMIPGDLMTEFRQSAAPRPPVSRAGAAVITAIWIVAATAIGWWLWKAWDP
jgi:uncharacterized membrane protein YkvA (DUF1232 family)